MELELDLASERRLYEAGIRPSAEIGLLLLSRLEQAEQAVARVRAMAQDWEANGNSCAVGDRSADVWHATANAIRRALDGDGRG